MWSVTVTLVYSASLGPESSPAAAREAFRSGLVRPTAGIAHGYVQCNLLALPQEDAFDFLLFAQRNPKSCPIVEVLDAGELNSPIMPQGDISRDLPSYRIFEHGQMVKEVADASSYWRNDLVAFLIGCSFTFESALLDAGLHVAHIQQGRNVPMYRTNVATRQAGKFSGPMVVSMRPFAPGQIADAARITARFPGMHGAPVHVGDPAALGIADLSRPDFGEAVDIAPGEVPVFWGCGVTPQAVVMDSAPDFAISHSPGHMLITDAPNSAFQVP